MAIEHDKLRQIVDAVESFPRTEWGGYSANKVRRDGVLTENGLTFVHDDLPFGQLYAGLTVLSRDMYFYLLEHSRPDSAMFDDVLRQVIAQERATYGTNAFPEYKTLPIRVEPPLPTGLARRLAAGEIAIEALGNPQIVHEWTSKVGKRLAAWFVNRAKPVICDPKGVYGLFEDKKVSERDRVTSLAEAILIGTVASSGAFWYALAAFIAVIVVKQGLKRVCEGEVLAVTVTA